MCEIFFLECLTVLSAAAARRSRTGKVCGRAEVNEGKGVLAAKPARLICGVDMLRKRDGELGLEEEAGGRKREEEGGGRRWAGHINTERASGGG